MATPDPKSPLRSDHRFIKRVIQTILEGKVEYVPAEFDLVGRVFTKAGGSWIRIFQGGSPKDIGLLKRILRRALKGGYLTKKYQWDGGR